MKQSKQYGINYMAAHPKISMNGNGHMNPWYKDKTRIRTIAGIAGFVIGSILTIFLVRRNSK